MDDTNKEDNQNSAAPSPTAEAPTPSTAADSSPTGAVDATPEGVEAAGAGAPTEEAASGAGAADPAAGSDDDDVIIGEAEVQSGPEAELAKLQEENKRLREQLLRTAADFDNFRKRARRDQSDAERKSREDFLRELLPVFDNLERAASHALSATDVKSLADGVAMVMRQFTDTLGNLGIERLNAVGSPFDPTLHEAIQHLETTDHPPGTVAHEALAGYRAGERLVRAAMVVVAKAPAGTTPEADADGDA